MNVSHDSSADLGDDMTMDVDEIDRQVQEHMDAKVEAFRALVDPLTHDVLQAATLLKRSDSQFARRTYCRTVFSLMEGVLFALRYWELQTIEFSAGTMLRFARTDAERTLLREIEYNLEDNGTLKERPRFQQFLPYLRFTLNTCRAWKVVDYSGSGWHAMRRAQEVRNRITHPKRPEELDISDEDLEQTRLAARWFNDAVGP